MYNQNAEPIITIPVTLDQSIELTPQQVVMIPSSLIIIAGVIAMLKLTFDIDRK